MSIENVLTRKDFQNGVLCGACNAVYMDPRAMNTVRIADAKLLFCSSCQTHIGVILDQAPQAKSA